MKKIWGLLLLVHSVFAGGNLLPQELRVPGGVAIIDVGPASENVMVKFRHHRIATVIQADRRIAVLGLPLSLSAGSVEIVIDNGEESRSLSLTINDKNYPIQKLSVEPKFVNPPADVQERINREAAETNALYSSFSALDPQWRMQKPALGTWSSSFGLRREFNGEARNPHSGADIAATRGSTVQAAASGQVVLAKELYFNGNTVIVDHGQGLLTMYCHLDRIDVQLGEPLREGQALGLVGATGRVTGPHLHWSVSLNNARVDPALFIANTAD